MNRSVHHIDSNRSGERALWIFILLLTSLSSYKIGQRVERSESPPLTENHRSDQVVVTERMELSPPVMDQGLSASAPVCPPVSCPPCDCEAEPPPPPKKKKRRRPPPPKASSPVDRQRLLAWVKRYSPRLKRCRDAGQPIYRLHAKVTLNSKRDRILRTKVSGTDVPRRAISCVERDLKRWPAPRRLSKDHPSLLIFGLQLD